MNYFRRQVKFPIILCSCLLLIALTLVKIYPLEEKKEINWNDSAENLTFAYNISKYGIFSDSREDIPEITPSFKREPLYPLLMAFMMKVSPVKPKLDDILTQAKNSHSLIIFLKCLNILVLLLIGSTIYVVAQLLELGKASATVAVLLTVLNEAFLYSLQVFNTESLASLFIILLSISSYINVKSSSGISQTIDPIQQQLLVPQKFRSRFHQKQWLSAIVAGISLGGLILVKAVFLYLGIFLFFVYIIIYSKTRLKAVLKNCILILFIGYLTCGIWQFRNYREFGSYAVAGRSGEILAIRAEFTKMSWQDYPYAFCAYTPICGDPVMKNLMPETYGLFDRENSNGFYRRTKNRIKLMQFDGDGAQLNLSLEEELSENSLRIIKKNWLMNVGLIFVFLYRGTITNFPYFIPLLCVVPRCFQREKWEMIIFLLPTLYSISIYAVLSHYIPRYSVPLLPTLSILLAPVLVDIFLGISSRIKKAY